MDPPPLTRFREAVRELDQLAADVDRTGELPRAAFDRLARAGAFALSVPVDLGGHGLSLPELQPYLEAAAEGPGFARMLVHVANGFWRPLVAFGTAEQRALVTRMATGERFCAFALTERSGGTGRDLHSRAERRDGGWTLRGEKHLITFADRADYFLLTAATDDRHAADSLTTFVVPRDTPGLVIDADQQTMGLAGTGHGRLFFEGLTVADSARLGAVGQGLAVGMSFLDYSRISLATCMVGVAQRALDESVRYARTRTTFGRPIASRQAIQTHLADMQADVAAARAFARDVGARYAAGTAGAAEAAAAKLFCQGMVGRVTDLALRVHGGYGYSTDAVVERLYRDARGFWFEEGTAEIQQLVIARHLLTED